MTCNDTQTHCLPADAMICKDMFCIHIHCHSCWCIPFEWIRTEWMRIEGIRIGGIRIAWIRIETIRIDKISIDRIRVEWICVGWCLLICMVWHTPTIFWRTLRPNVFREKMTQNGRRCFRAAFWKSPRWEMIWRDYWISFRLLWNTAASWDLGNVSDQSSSAWRFQRRPAVRREKNRLS